MARPARKSTPARRPRRTVPRVVVARSVPRGPQVDLGEDPRGHIVCRVCGRIQSVELTELDRHLLTQLAAQHPDGWSVDRIAFSLTGACLRCREGAGR